MDLEDNLKITAMELDDALNYEINQNNEIQYALLLSCMIGVSYLDDLKKNDLQLYILKALNIHLEDESSNKYRRYFLEIIEAKFVKYVRELDLPIPKLDEKIVKKQKKNLKIKIPTI